LNRGRLARDLQQRVRGEVRFDEGSRALYANDASIYRQVPVGVVLPCDAEDVVGALEVCREHQAPIFGRGAGTGLAGQSVNDAVMFDFTKYMHHIAGIDPAARTARVQPGVICDHLRAAAGEHGLTFPVDPATHDRCTLGGMIGNNSCGTHSVMGGKTVDNVISLDVVTYDGTRMTVGPDTDTHHEEIIAAGGRRGRIYRDLRDLRDRYAELIRTRYPDIPRRVSGYNLDALLPEAGLDLAKALVGSESTCVLVLEATVRLMADPPHHSLLVAGFPDAATAADHVPELLETPVIGLECFDSGVVANLGKHHQHPPGIAELPEGSAWLLAEYGAEHRNAASQLVEDARGRVTEPGVTALFEDETRQGEVWEIRRSAIEFARVPGEHAGLAGWEDAAVAPARLGDYIREYTALMDRHGYHAALFGHFGQGCMHNRLDLDLASAPGIENFRQFIDEAGDLVARFGGSLSGEHGDGQLRAEQLAKMFGPELVAAFAEFKAIFDPDDRMNPGKVVRPNSAVDNLRWGPDYQPREVATHFGYPSDEHGFADAVNRCFGVGLCRHTSGGTMCPSYMVTREEKHSTRGRARLLFEMMNGHLGPASGNDKGWRDPHVKESLDLCLACKGCKGDCPVSVDIASYKAEFLSHYYAGRLRPRPAYALGLLPIWARLAARAPGLTNAALATPGLSTVGKLAAGVEPARTVPPFAAQPFRAWFATHEPRATGSPVMLFPDTFTNYFDPQIGIAAVEVLEHAGYRVQLPGKQLCCGRPLYDYGMLPTAKRWLRATLGELREPIRAGTPLVGLEPSCLAVFRDELGNLLPDDPDAARLAEQSMSLAELLSKSGYQPPGAAPAGAGPGPLPPARRRRSGGGHEPVPADGPGAFPPGLRLLRHGRQLRLRTRREIPRLDGRRGTSDPPRGARGGRPDTHPRRRVLLPQPDRRGHRPAAAAPGPGAGPRPARDHERRARHAGAVPGTGLPVQRATRRRGTRRRHRRHGGPGGSSSRRAPAYPLSRRGSAMAKTTSDLIVERLLGWGIDVCFGINGDQLNGFVESLRTHSEQMRFVHVRHEENAALAAVGYAKFTGRPAACVATAGPGAVHVLNGIYDARIDGVPLVAITGMSYHDVIGAHLIQDLDSPALFSAACEFSERVMGPAHAVVATDLAVRNALAGNGPAHLGIPIDVQNWTEDTNSAKNPPGHTSLAPQTQVPLPPESELARAAEVLGGCSRVAIMAGAGARGAGERLEEVAELLGAPIVKAGLGKDAVPDESPLTTGGMGLIGTRASQEALENCDGFLIVGSSSPYYEFWPTPGQARAVQIDIDPAMIALRYPVEVGLAGDAEATLTALLPRLTRTADRSFLEQARRTTQAWWELLREQATTPASPMKPQTICWHLGELLADDTILTGDAGTVTMWGARVPLRRGMRYSFSGTHCSMGSAVPYAIGAQLAYPGRPVVAFLGDGALSMGMGELATLAQYRLPITVVVLHNNSLALEIWEQNALLGNPQYGCELSSIDFTKVAEGCGLATYRIEETEQARDTLAAALTHDGPSLVECLVDPYEAPFGDVVKPGQAENIVNAYARGEPGRARMAASLLDPARRGLSPAVQHVEGKLRSYTE
jgi:thiamine pyrophosphate-dependent acetolactate synthase large subunit-like protein/FAD/FMN-containing dehydrogenase/Fe-S oxidoreductase